MVIRPVEREELEAVYAIELMSFNNPYPYWYLEFLHALSGEFFLGAYDSGGRLIGYIIALPMNGPACHIASIAVLPEYRRRRVGSMLLQSVMEVCCSRGKLVHVLEVEISNYPAQLLYTSNGFRAYRAVKDYYGEGRHALRMATVDAECAGGSAGGNIE